MSHRFNFNPDHLVIADPYPETLGLASLTIRVPKSFQGDAEIWWYPTGKLADEDRQIFTCNSNALLQGVFRHVQGVRPNPLFDARVVALVMHAFYRARIEAAAQLEASYTWQPFATADLSPPRTDFDLAVDNAKRGLGAVMTTAWTAHQESLLSEADYKEVSHTASKLRRAFDELGTK